jgi:hypothetical protein
MVQVFKVIDTGETVEIKDDEDIKDLLETDEVYIIVSEHRDKTIWLWKGAKSSVRRKFIGAQKSQDVRGQVGMMYSVIPIDEGEEDPELIKVLGGSPSEGIAKEIKDDREGLETHPLMQKQVFEPPSPAEGMKIGVSPQAKAGIGPLYTGEESISQISQPAADYKEVMQKLEEIAIPEGWEREMIIIGSQTYAVIEKVQTFLGKKQTEKVIERISSIPEGVFFAEGYTPRILSENGNVLAIEFLKRSGGAEAGKHPDLSDEKKAFLSDQLKKQLGS